MEFITVNAQNIENEHICCAISNNTDCQVASKKAWLKERFCDGLVFLRGDVRGKCFIEYIPAENAFAPITAPNYMYIDCLWVSGQFKGAGNSTLLLDKCIADSKQKGKSGLCILSAKKKMPFLSDPGFLKHKGFVVADTAEPYYVLYYLPFSEKAEVPHFNAVAKTPHTNNGGYVLYYTHQCPYTAKYVPIIAGIAKSRNVEFKTVLLKTAKEAQQSPAHFTAYSLFFKGKFVTNEILSPKKFEKMLDANEDIK